MNYEWKYKNQIREIFNMSVVWMSHCKVNLHFTKITHTKLLIRRERQKIAETIKRKIVSNTNKKRNNRVFHMSRCGFDDVLDNF